MHRAVPPALAERLADAGFVAPEEEARELLEAAGGDAGRVEALVRRRLTGEPLAWITGRTTFCGLEVLVDPGVYVPRWHTEALARRAAQLLPEEGTAIDLCTGSGAIARVLRAARPRARVLATDLDPRAVACARRNGVDAHEGDLFAALPAARAADVVVAVVPYVPTPELALLQRDTLTFEAPLSYDGGEDGLRLLRRVAAESPAHLRPGGTLLLEVGGGQAATLAGDLAAAGFERPEPLLDEEGDVRGVQALLPGAAPAGDSQDRRARRRRPVPAARGRPPTPSPSATSGRRGGMCAVSASFGPVVPILRMYDMAATRRFYVEYLGCTIDWQDGDGAGPTYLQVSRDDLVLHLSSHHDDGTPGTAVLIETREIAALHRQLHETGYRFLLPGLEEHPLGHEMTLIDPASNRLRFFERDAPDAA